MTEWKWIERYAEQFAACAVTTGETAVVLSETRSRSEIVETARLALAQMGTEVVDLVLPTPANPGPLPIRSTGASVGVSPASKPAASATSPHVARRSDIECLTSRVRPFDAQWYS